MKMREARMNSALRTAARLEISQNSHDQNLGPALGPTLQIGEKGAAAGRTRRLIVDWIAAAA
ncbi:hypothetical protein X747_24865 [Mesorhizobium sp. LNJC384A00]|nr:hypothetical protein X765_20385 [Mesorhizobium sp. LSHC440B00]ESX36488.1 hypothetical protein X763_14690 [Mesorhizobium sp. LSHC432A00]ESX41888.1 hypothetical protein X764_12675 [Mesorhizobium sp. LSHC440A00]ESX78413.1 hypothetical protein X757_07580 [Mesorhizobium sp. LSHC414A00]ESY20691.1 hypothetical protein X750_17500 [Mesorhizobium sp. LNJC394B00]ESY22462.1 hypothetical protein X751_09075 [Mesorhizobium sp. LNJC395A00]ESY37895.1 hypothetical protein X747_24865 [Mesorhizobium sp. LNJC3